MVIKNDTKGFAKSRGGLKFRQKSLGGHNEEFKSLNFFNTKKAEHWVQVFATIKIKNHKKDFAKS